MSRKNTAMENIVLLHNRIVNKQKEIRSPEVLERVTNFMAELRCVGMIEGLEMNGRPGRYFLIDGNSWGKACRILKAPAAPSFVIWEEADFFSYLDSFVSALVKPRTGKGLPDKRY